MHIFFLAATDRRWYFFCERESFIDQVSSLQTRLLTLSCGELRST
jgi:hypothetical protein